MEMTVIIITVHLCILVTRGGRGDRQHAPADRVGQHRRDERGLDAGLHGAACSGHHHEGG